MTDKQIEQGLKACSESITVTCGVDCPNKIQGACRTHLVADALDYINRLKEEITSLTGAWEAALTDKENLERTLEEVNEKLEKVHEETAKEILQPLHYEIEREKCAGALYADFNYGLDTALNKIEYLAEKYEVEIE